FLVDRFSVLPGVSRVRVGGGLEYAMRIWLDRTALAAHNLTPADVESALRSENVELPGGQIESAERQFVVRLPRGFSQPEEFESIVVSRGENNHPIRLRDIARVELGVVEERTLFRGDGVTRVGLGIVRQSTANVMEVASAARAEVDYLQDRLPDGMSLTVIYDASIFVQTAVKQVIMTLFITIGLVVVVIYLFIGNLRTTLIPAITVPIALIGAFTGLALFGFTINLLTLLALVLAIGLIVDDAIVVLENINRRIQQYGETPLVAAFYGTRQIAFAVVATTLVLIAVFVPLAFIEGDLGRLFTEFSITLAFAVLLSSIVALTLTPMMASKILKEKQKEGLFLRFVNLSVAGMQAVYRVLLGWALRLRWLVVLGFVAAIGATYWFAQQLPNEYAPREDRGSFFIFVSAPEGASFEYMRDYMDEIEARLLPMLDDGEVAHFMISSPRALGNIENFNSGFVVVILEDWNQRRSGFEIMKEVRQKLVDLPGVRAFPVMRQGLGQRVESPVQYVLGGGTYEEIAAWRDQLFAHIREDNPRLLNLDSDYKETQPQLFVEIDYERATALGVRISEIGRTMETLLGGRSVTTYVDDGQEYDVIIEGERALQRSPDAINSIYVRSETSGNLIPLSQLVTVIDRAGPATLNRFDRIRAITISADLADDYTLGEALAYLDQTVADILPAEVQTDVKGASRDYLQASGETAFLLIMGALIVFLVLAAQFESLVHPFVIMLTVPLAIIGALAGLYYSGQSLNIYSQIGLVMLMGLAAKNGILIVEFTNQLRQQQRSFRDALIEASVLRLRPIVMTSVTTMAGTIALIASSGAGSESRFVIGMVILTGVASSMILTLFVIPVAYDILARRTKTPGAVARQLAEETQRIDSVTRNNQRA
ncbi:MAG TPA: efflux RND transporter permease subunit, partial [Halothiobacillaceae bacterium]|nr:efflux RND transporter permease subunit [Halothiobacillaceae bacterium]